MKSGPGSRSSARPAGFMVVLTVAQSRTSEAFATIEAFIAGAVSDDDMATARACGRVLLKMGDRVAQAFNIAPGAGSRVLAVAIRANGGFNVQRLAVFRQRQFRHWTIDFFSYFLRQPGNRQLRLVTIRRVGLAIARDKLITHPTKYVIGDR